MRPSHQIAQLHPDLTNQFSIIEERKCDRIASSFTELPKEKFSRLAAEFDAVADVANAEKHYVNHLIDFPADADKWGEYAQFALKHGLQIKAEQCINRQIDC